MTSEKIKHLEFIQNAISRMAQNSFLLKGWAITIIVALFALAAKDSSETYMLLPILPLVMFWLLDGYYLAQERLFRALYKEAIQTQTKKAFGPFSMDTSKYKRFSYEKGRNTWIKAIFSRTLVIFYAPILAVIVGFCVYFGLGGKLFR